MAYHRRGMRFEPNLSILFTELPLLERPAAAAAAGFEAAEIWWPFDEPDPPGARIDELIRAFDGAGVVLACLNFYAGDFGAGERGLISVPGEQARFRANVEVAVELAGKLHCGTLNALYGNRAVDATPDRQEALAIENLAAAVNAARRIGAQVVVEALNRVEYPRYGLHSVDQVVTFLDRVHDASGVVARCSLDVYHAAMTGDRLVESVARHGDRIGHVQLADVPGRHEPGTGTIDFPSVLDALERQGYEGWVGLEYIPSSESGASLHATIDWLAAHAPTPRA